MNMIYIIEEYQRKGFGKALVSFWENDMRDKGYQNVLTSTLSNEEAQHFYRKLGYKDIGGFTYLDEPLEILLHKEILHGN
jgi:ribosomal protein S18 acetylase RimI-like enzyme